ncbi:MAG: helix-turn-helix domain-containing protein [Acidithiobacillus sp.]
MHITLEDIAGMASPGWEGFEEENEEVEEVEEGDSKENKNNEEEPKVVQYGADGRRLGMATGDLCDYLRNQHMSLYHRLGQEFSRIQKKYPKDGADLKILMRLAAGMPYLEIAARLGRSHKTVKNAAKRLRQFRDTGIVKLLPPDQVETGIALMAPFKKSKAGRKARGWLGMEAPRTAQTATIYDLFGDPIQAKKQPCKPRKAVQRVRVACAGQMDLFREAA